MLGPGWWKCTGPSLRAWTNWLTSGSSDWRTCSGVPCAATRPLASTITWSTMRKVSGISCETMMLVMPSVSFSCRISRDAVPSEIGSRPENGSSYMINSGSSAIARASATRRFMPPEISDGIRSRAPRKPTACSFISTMSRIRRSGSVVCSRKGKATFSNTLKSANSAPNWNSMPMRRRIA